MLPVIQYWANQEPCFFRPHPLPLLLLNTTDDCLQIVTQSSSSAYSSYFRDYYKLHTRHIFLNTQLSGLLLSHYAAKFISFEMNLSRLLQEVKRTGTTRFCDEICLIHHGDGRSFCLVLPSRQRMNMNFELSLSPSLSERERGGKRQFKIAHTHIHTHLATHSLSDRRMRNDCTKV